MRSACVVMTVVVGAVVPVTAASSALPPTAANLACAAQVVSSWPLTQIANEIIVVSVKAMNVAAMVRRHQRDSSVRTGGDGEGPASGC